MLTDYRQWGGVWEKLLTFTALLREAWATLPESSSQPLPATPAQSRNLAHASLETAVYLCNLSVLRGSTFGKRLLSKLGLKAYNYFLNLKFMLSFILRREEFQSPLGR